MESIIYVGMDVHKDSYSVCCYKSKEDRYYYEKKILAESKRVIKYLESVKKELGEETLFICGYEAGPTESWLLMCSNGTNIIKASGKS